MLGGSKDKRKRIDAIAAVLHEAAETHHRVFRITDGVDDDWASWYADWMLDLSELPMLLDSHPIRSHLVHALVQLDRDYQSHEGSNNDSEEESERNEPWPQFYAARLVELFPAQHLS